MPKLKLFLSFLLLIITDKSYSQVTRDDYFESGKIDYEKGYLISAASKFTTAIEMDSTFADAYYYRGLTYKKGIRADFNKQALEDFKKCIALDSTKDYWQAYFYLARRSFYSDNSYMRYFDIAHKLQPKNVEIILARAFAKRWMNIDSKEALEDYNLALSIEPKNINALIAKGNYYINKDNKEAIKILKYALKLNRADAGIYYSLGNAYYSYNKEGHKRNYCKYYKKARKLGYMGYVHYMKDCGIKPITK